MTPHLFLLYIIPVQDPHSYPPLRSASMPLYSFDADLSISLQLGHFPTVNDHTSASRALFPLSFSSISTNYHSPSTLYCPLLTLRHKAQLSINSQRRGTLSISFTLFRRFYHYSPPSILTFCYLPFTSGMSYHPSMPWTVIVHPVSLLSRSLSNHSVGSTLIIVLPYTLVFITCSSVLDSSTRLSTVVSLPLGLALTPPVRGDFKAIYRPCMPNLFRSIIDVLWVWSAHWMLRERVRRACLALTQVQGRSGSTYRWSTYRSPLPRINLMPGRRFGSAEEESFFHPKYIVWGTLEVLISFQSRDLEVHVEELEKIGERSLSDFIGTLFTDA
ncbi:benzoate 4-monooxygenase cytochrome p450 [Moniliophthora roreri]|nr:benzoate 4-monooxygenase cytochrome p450 [Moniliophthora roreri]